MILNKIEEFCGKRIFSQRFYLDDCKVKLNVQTFVLRDLSLIINPDVEHRREQNIVIVGSNLEHLSNNIQNTVPVKPFLGKKRDHVFKYLSDYLITRVLPSNDVRDLIK